MADLEEFHTCIIGAGMSGLCMALQLQARSSWWSRDKASFVLLDAAAEVGGTWFEAAGYPGAACDVPSHLYSYSFAQNPKWTRKFAGAAEIRGYLSSVAAAGGVMPHVRCGLRVVSATWLAGEGRWEVRAVPSGALPGVSAGVTLRARFLVSALGALYTPEIPSLPGAGSFEGLRLHSARWPRGEAAPRLAGARVGVVGTGASAAQLVPALAREVAHLTVFQRTPAWVIPRRDWAASDRARSLFAALPLLQWAYGALIFLTLDAQYFAFIKPLAAWLRKAAERGARRHLARQVKDPALREALTPRYPMGCKRVLLSDEFYPALASPKCTLVTAAIAGETQRGLRTADGTEHALDAIVYATGFDVQGSMSAVDVRGAGGAQLAARMRAAADTYLGITVADFPNLFLLLGPNTGLGHNSIIAMVECQVRYAVACMARAEARGPRAAIAPRPAAQAAWAARAQERLADTVWTGCNSWYNRQGGRNITMWPGTVTEYWWTTLWPRWADFEVAAEPTEAEASEPSSERASGETSSKGGARAAPRQRAGAGRKRE